VVTSKGKGLLILKSIQTISDAHEVSYPGGSAKGPYTLKGHINPKLNCAVLLCKKLHEKLN
jgi:hypothetical protein